MFEFIEKLSTIELFWIGLGFFGQALFFARFIVQWLVSEKRGESVIPLSFWHLSLLGSIVLLFYSIYRKDPVFIAGFSLNMLIYLRNLALIRKKSLQK